MTLVIAAVVVVVIVVVVLALALTGAIPGLGGSNNASTSGQTYSQSMAAAGSATSGYHGGGYNAVYAIGFASSGAVSLPVSVLSSALTASVCTFTAISSTSSFTIPASSNLSTGSDPIWIFIEHNTSGLLVVVVSGGSATILGTLGGSSTCTTTLGALTALPSTLADSSTAALALDQRGGYAFLKAHPTAIASDLAFGGISGVTGPQWIVGYAGCSASASGTTGPEITADESGSATVTSISNSTGNCGFSTGSPGGGGGGGGGGTGGPLTSAFAIGSVTVGTEYTLPVYNFTVTSASTGIEYQNLVLSVTGSTSLPAGTSLDVYAGSSPVAFYSFSSNSWSGGTTTIATGDVLSLLTTSSLAGDTLVFTGTGGYTGTVNGSL